MVLKYTTIRVSTDAHKIFKSLIKEYRKKNRSFRINEYIIQIFNDALVKLKRDQ